MTKNNYQQEGNSTKIKRIHGLVKSIIILEKEKEGLTTYKRQLDDANKYYETVKKIKGHGKRAGKHA